MSGDKERFDPRNDRGRIAYEHFHRYAICREIVQDRDVLDLACGTGYGSSILAQTARTVAGLDIDQASISEAQATYDLPNLSYVTGDCFKLPFDEGSFDIVVANEMIEHVEDHDALIAEAKRVLRPGGLFIVSTPNKPVYNRYKPPNPFHVAEMTINEFTRLLQRHFQKTSQFGLRMLLSSAAFPLFGRAPSNRQEARLFQGEYVSGGKLSLVEREMELSDPEYVLAVCSDNEIPDLNLGSSIYLTPEDDLWLEHERILAWASGIHEEDEAIKAKLRQLQSDLGDREYELSEARKSLDAAQKTVEQQRAELETQRKSNSQQFDAFKSDVNAELENNRQTRKLSLHLLRRMSGVDSPAGEQGIVESIFLVQERLIRQEAEIARVPELEKRLNEALSSLEATRMDAATTSEAAETKNKQDISSLKAQRAELREKLGQREQELRTALTEIKLRESSLAEMKGQLAAASSRSRALDEEASKLRTEIEVLRENERRGEAHAKRITEMEHLSTEALSKARKDLASERENTEAIARTLETERAHLAQVREDLDLERKRSNEAIASSTALQNDVTTLKAELAELSARTMLLSAEAETAKTEATGLESKLSKEKSRNKDLQTKLADRGRRQAAIERHTAEIGIQLDEATERSNAAEHALDAAISRAEAARRMAEDLNHRIAFARLHERIFAELSEASHAVRRHFLAAPKHKSIDFKRLTALAATPLGKPSLFSEHWLQRQLDGNGQRASWRQYCKDPALFGLDPHPLFSAAYYFEQLPLLNGAPYNPLLHYLSHGWREGLSPHPLFNGDWYLAKNGDVLASGMNPLDHYLTYGWREGRSANPIFGEREYLNRYPDVERAGTAPLLHYAEFGRAEGREVSSNVVDLNAVNMLPTEARSQGMMHYLMTSKRVILPSTEEGFWRDRQDPKAERWPPKHVDDYWLPQALRDYIIESHGEESIPLYWYLFSIMNRYAETGLEFQGTKDCTVLLDRAKELANLPRRTGENRVEPEASIIVPVYNNLLDTMLCLVSVLELRDLASFEIIVADDCSTDATQAVIPQIGGCVRYIRHPENKGFLGNCNAAALHAGGRNIILLNNDTIVLPGWLDQMLNPFIQYGDVGFVGAKLLNWDGTLQEAGGIFWKDGSAWNFGRNQDPREPQFNYLKDVDYCSGASIAIPMPLWQDLGGFDPIYEPAYCEDSDIAFRIRAKGLRTIYNPAAQLVHHEGRSHGRDTASGIKAYQVANQEKLLDRWRKTLEAENYPNAENVLRARDRSAQKPHVLVIDHYVPQFDQDAGSRTILQYVQTFLDMGFGVTFWPDNLYRDPKYAPVLQGMGVEVIYGAKYKDRFAEFLEERGDLYDVVLLSRPHVATHFLPTVRAKSRARILYYGHDLHFRRMEANLELNGEGSLDDIEAVKRMELEVCEKSDVIFYPAPEEIAYVSGKVPGDHLFLDTPAYIHSEDQLKAAERDLAKIRINGSRRLLFVGGFGHTPNREGILWFAQEVFPEILARMPQIKLDIVGSKAPPEIHELASDSISVLGFVSDEQLDDLYRMSAVAIAPLRFGAGVKGKVIEAMAKAVPVVTTTVGAQGIVPAEEFLFIGDSAEAFADAVIQAIDDRGEAENRARAGIGFLRENYSNARLRGIFHRAIFGDQAH